MANFLPRSIILTMVVSFAISFAVLYWQRKSQEQSMARVEPLQNVAVHVPAELPARPPIPERGAVTAQTMARPDLPEAAAKSGEEAPAETLPVAFHIRNRRDLHVIDGDIRNITSKPMSMPCARSIQAPRQPPKSALSLRQAKEKPTAQMMGSMQTDDQLIMQSAPYQDRVVRVP